MTVNPLISKLGYSPTDRLVIFHADDGGMCHGSNQALVDLSPGGIVKTGSIMTPCAWTPEMLQHCRTNPALDVGVHLTLTSEWDSYRWSPLTTRDPASGLLDQDGYFWQSTEQVRAKLNVKAAVAEMRAQIEKVLAAGVDV